MTGFDARDLAVPVIAAPMAGGPSTPELAAAVGNAGGLGFLAGGYLSAPALEARIRHARTLTSGPVGVNLFVPGPSSATPSEIAAYAARLAPTAASLGVGLGVPTEDDDDWAAKLDVVRDLAPEVVTFTFGLPSREVLASLPRSAVGVTVTTAEEALLAHSRGVRLLILQGPEAGGHRGTFDPRAVPSRQPRDVLVALVRRTLPDVVIAAAGGVSDHAEAASALASGANAVQAGTAFLLSDEAGTSAVHQNALSDPDFAETTLTRAFTGRWARGLTNQFIRDHHEAAPVGYPDVHQLTAPIRKAAVTRGDPELAHLWAGTGFRATQRGPAAAIVAALGTVEQAGRLPTDPD